LLDGGNATSRPGYGLRIFEGRMMALAVKFYTVASKLADLESGGKPRALQSINRGADHDHVVNMQMVGAGAPPLLGLCPLRLGKQPYRCLAAMDARPRL